MNITLEKQNPTSARLRVKLAETDYAPGVEEQVKEYSKKAQIKGFRPGKVPAGLIRKMYGKSLMVDAINKLLHESVNSYIKENNLRILGEPLPERTEENIDWDTQKEFDFSYELGLLPEFELNLGEMATVEGYKITVDDATLEETYEHMQRQFGTTTNPEVVAENDLVYGELTQLEGEFKTSTLLPLAKMTSQEAFIGKQKDDVVTFDLQKAFNNDATAIANATGASKDEAAALTGNFEFKIANITRSEPAPIDQDFFDKIFGKDAVSSREEFDEKVRETIRDNYEQEASKVLNHQIVDKLVNETKIDVPREFMKKWLLTANEGKLTTEQIDENIENYERELKWSMIRNKVVEDNDLKVTNEEVVNRTKEKLMAQFNMPEISEDMAETMNQYVDSILRQENGKNYMNEYEAILAEKVIERLKETLTVVEREVTAEEFRNMSF